MGRFRPLQGLRAQLILHSLLQVLMRQGSAAQDEAGNCLKAMQVAGAVINIWFYNLPAGAAEGARYVASMDLVQKYRRAMSYSLTGLDQERVITSLRDSMSLLTNRVG